MPKKMSVLTEMIEGKELQESDAHCPTRADNLLITNQLLYQMSLRGLNQ